MFEFNLQVYDMNLIHIYILETQIRKVGVRIQSVDVPSVSYIYIEYIQYKHRAILTDHIAAD